MTRKAYIYSEENPGYAKELRNYILDHVIFNADKFEVIAYREEYARVLQNLDGICFIIDFNEVNLTDAKDLKIDYSLSYRDYALPSSYSNLNIDNSFQDDSFIEYLEAGFQNLQGLVDKWFMSKLQPSHPNSNLDNTDFMFYSHNRKTNEYKVHIYLIVASVFLPFAIVGTYLIPVISIVNKVMTEKENYVKMGMKLMGSNELVYWVSWWVFFFIYQWGISLVMAGFLVVYLFTNLSILVVFVILAMFGCTSIVFVTALTTFFKRTYIAILFILFIYFFSFNLKLLYNDNDLRPFWVALGSTLPTLSVQFSFNYLYQVEAGGFQYGLDMLWVKVQGYSLNDVLGGQLFGLVFFALLTLYLDQVIPTTTESAKPWHFVFTEGYHIFERYFYTSARLNEQYVSVSSKDNFEFKAKCYEPLNAYYTHKLESKECLRISNLDKRYEGASVNALEDVSLDIFRDDIFVLLGPNGAGKSTTINILTGKLTKSGGAIAYAHHPDFDRFLEGNRSAIGICPQFNIIFPNLTAYEHLYLFAIFKGIPETQIEDHITKVCDDLNMSVFMDKQVCNLSGGQKRRVAIAISLLGQGEIVILDEPTAGLDPTSRRHLWHLLKQSKFGKVLIMSTHYMDEAEFLGDRIAIIDEGKVKACGSMQFLRDSFAKGVVAEVAFRTKSAIPAFNTFLDSKSISYQMNQIKTDKAAYLVPEHKDILKLLSILEDKSLSENYDIHNYNISQSKLDDIFFRIIEHKNYDHEIPEFLITENNNDSVGMADIEMDNHDEYKDSTIRHLYPAGELDQIHSSNSSQIKADLQKSKEKADCNVLRMKPQVHSEIDSAYNLYDDKEKNEVNLAKNDEVVYKMGSIFWSHFCANLLKRFRYNYKDLFGISCEILFPLLIVIGGMALTKFGVNFLAEMPWVPFHPREIAVYGKQRGISFLEYNQNLYYTSVRDNNQYLNLNFEENFYQSLSKLHDGINFKRVNIRDYDRGDDVVRRYFNSIFYFDEYLYEYFYGTEEYTLASKDPRPLGHLNLMANDYIPEFAGMGVTKRTFFMQVVFESTYRHHYPILQNWIHTAYIRTETGNPNVNIYARNYPLPWSPEEREALSSFPDIAFNGFLNLATALVGVGIMYFLMCEKESEMKNLIFLSGLQIHTYWLSNFLYDMLKYLVFFFLILLICYFYDLQEVLTLDMGKGPVFALGLLITGFSLTQCVYFYTLVFSSTGTAMIFILVFLSTIGTIMFMVYDILNVGILRERTGDAVDYFWFFFLANPNFILMELTAQVLRTGTVDLFDFSPLLSAWDWRVFKWNYYNLGCGAVYFILTLLMEYAHISRFFKRKLDISRLDQEVFAEDAVFVSESSKGEGQKKAIQGKEIIKHYGNDLLLNSVVEYTDKKLALKNVSFDVVEGDCYVLLGSNGAGKSTLFKIMLSEIQPTAGSVHIKEMEVTLQNIPEIRKHVGYCPQMNSYYDFLTVREHLEFILAIKNVEGGCGELLVQKKLQQLLLTRFEHYDACRLSGGNQRKLNYAIATLTNPELLFLDEPTSSMDPVARKMINENIIVNKGTRSNVFYCTHIIDEAEYVSDKIAILINGRIRAVGNSVELKAQFGQAYILWISLDSDPAKLPCKEAIVDEEVLAH